MINVKEESEPFFLITNMINECISLSLPIYIYIYIYIYVYHGPRLIQPVIYINLSFPFFLPLVQSDAVFELKKREILAPYDKHLKSFNHSKALDAALQVSAL